MSRHLLYSHDSFGLGHLRRSGLLAEAITAADDHEVLIATGSPRAESFSFSDGIDTLKLPAVTKDPDGGYRPRSLGGDMGRLLRLRADLLLAAADTYRPDTIVVDHAPIGLAGELLPLLDRLRRLRRRPRLVLGLRDIIDDADLVAQQWQRDGVWARLGDFDQILVYGDPTVTSTAQELHLAARLGQRVDHVGYVAPGLDAAAPSEEPYLLVTTGGGADGGRLLEACLAAAARGAFGTVRVVMVTGPLLSEDDRRALSRRAEAGAATRRGSLELLGFSDRMRELIAGAAGVVSMAGYNTVVEELAVGVPALLVPRTSFRHEQRIRAERLADRSRLRSCPLGALTPAVLADFADRCCDPSTIAARDAGPGHTLRLDGAAGAATAIGADPTRPRLPLPDPVRAPRLVHHLETVHV